MESSSPRRVRGRRAIRLDRREPARTHVIGNIKFDFGYPPDMATRGQELRRC
jgi:hypothetical protein